jgi:hypothetical protein
MKFSKELKRIENRKKRLEGVYGSALASYSSIYRILGEIKEEEGEGDNALFRLGDYVINELKGEGNELEEIDERYDILDERLEKLEGSIKNLRSSISRIRDSGKFLSDLLYIELENRK